METNLFTTEDLKVLDEKGIEVKQVLSQIEMFKNGFPYANLVKPATIKDGISKLSEENEIKYIELYNEQSKKLKIVKFVPASGAATRMFKDLFTFMEKYKATDADFTEILVDRSFNSIYNFFDKIKNFAFYEELKNYFIQKNEDIEAILNNMEYVKILKALLTDKGLKYGVKPKGLLTFHEYKDCLRSASEEHLIEGVFYAKSSLDKVRVHFTVSPEHLKAFQTKINNVKKYFEDEHKVQFEVSFSIQKSSSDTIAVDMNNNLFRDVENKLVFRPAGHGALIENLYDIDADLIFIKNIDNVTHDNKKEITIKYKKIIAGKLLSIRDKISNYINLLKNEAEISEKQIAEILKFSEKEVHMHIPANFENKTQNEKCKFLYNLLNRPIRVCGMVPNEGEPGGGPFWVKDKNENISLQIIESSQIDKSDTNQMDILTKSTHFNPVDLVCCITDYEGKKFNLNEFIDKETGFISIKSKDGQDLKAMELPGLWNGAMAHWITIFIEVPIETFSPVKTVWDLLRCEHQGIKICN